MCTLENLVENFLLYFVVIMTWLMLGWQTYLILRQKGLLKRLVNLPPSIEGLMSKSIYDKARAYSMDKLNFEIADNFYNSSFNTVFLLTFSYKYLWDWSAETAQYFGLNAENEIIVTAIFLVAMNLAFQLIELPFTIYNTFVIEKKYNFNKQDPWFFLKDQLLLHTVSQVIANPVICSMIWIIKNGGDYFFLYLWLFAVAVILLLIIIYPEVIAPLFDKYDPLPEGELRKRIEELASSVEFPLYKLFVVESSKRSSHSNAYLYGFHRHKRIVLFDTLVKEYYSKKVKKDKATEPTKEEAEKKEEEPKKEEKKEKESSEQEDNSIGCETEEILAVLAHELGHWKHSHALKRFFLIQVKILVYILLYAQLLNYKPIYAAFGFVDFQPTFIGLKIVTIYLLMPLTTVMHFLLVVISRRFEFEADDFACRLGRGEHLKKALLKLQKDNLGYPLYDKLYSSWYHSHPPLLERLEAIDKRL